MPRAEDLRATGEGKMNNEIKESPEFIFQNGRRYKLDDMPVRLKGGPANGMETLESRGLRPGTIIFIRTVTEQMRIWDSTKPWTSPFQSVDVKYRITRKTEGIFTVARYVPTPRITI